MSQLGTLIERHTAGLGGLVWLALEKEDGQTLVEYGLILALVAAIMGAVLVVLSGTISGMFTTASVHI